MVRKASRIIQTIRDVVLLVLCSVLISTSIGPGKEFANLIFAGICAVILTLIALNIISNVLKVQRKGYFRYNAIFQLLLGIFLSLGLFPPLGIVLVIFNAAVLVTLWEKKTAEERRGHPPKPITRKYRAFIGVGALIMFSAILLSWFNTINFPLIGVYFGSTSLTEASNQISGPIAMMFGFLALVGAPISLIFGLLGLFKRMFAWTSGILAVVIGIGWVISMTTTVGLGAFVFTLGGVLMLATPIVTR